MTPINISYYKNAKDNKGGIISVNDAIKRIKTDALLVEATQHYRSLPDGKEKDEKKKNLFPAVTWSGLFSKRKAEAIQQHSGLICIDIDKLETEQLNGFKKLLTNDKHVYLMFISPSGKGLKILFKIQADATTHLQYFNYISFYLQKEYGLQVDPSGKDVSRLCFLCYDAQPYFNVDAELISIPADFEVKPAPQQPKPLTKKQETQLSNTSETPNDVFEFTQNISVYSEGNRNNFVFLYANNCNRKGIDYNDCLHFALQAFSDLTESEVTTSIKSAYKNTNQHATFKRKTTTGRTKNGNETAGKNAVQNNAGNNQNTHNAQTTPGNQSQNGNTGSRNDYAGRSNEDAGGNVQAGNTEKEVNFIKFWTTSFNEKTGNETYSIDYIGFYDFLESIGVYNLKLNGANVELIYLKNNIVTPLIINNTRNDVKVLMNQFCKQHNLRAVLQMLHRGQDKYFARKQFINLSYKEVDFLRDTKEVSYFFHSNCVVEVSAQGITTRDYKNGEKALWSSQINDKPFYRKKVEMENDEKGFIDPKSLNSEFARYMLLACCNPNTVESPEIQKQRLKSHMTAFGYMIDGYKPSNCKAIVAVDHKKAEDKTEQNGGSGKGLFAKALGYVKQRFIVDGERFDPKDNSVFESVTLDTKIITVCDCNPRFNFRYFFNSITDDFTFRKMYIGPVTIPFKDSPKFYFDTNFSFQGEGSSFRRRQHVIEFDDYFNDEYTPLHEFNHSLFIDWDDDEFNMFYNYAYECCYLWKTEGLIDYPSGNYQERKLINECPQEFIDWADEEKEIDGKPVPGQLANLPRNVPLTKIALFESYNKHCEKWKLKNASPHIFSKWLKRYCITRGLTFYSRKAGSKETYWIFTPEHLKSKPIQTSQNEITF